MCLPFKSLVFLIALCTAVSYSKSQDLSENWKCIDKVYRNDMFNISIKCLDSLNWMVLSNEITNKGFLVRKTTNGGANWKNILRDSLIRKTDANGKPIFIEPAKANDLAFFSKENAILACDSGIIWRTSDGGINWLKIKISGADSSIDFFNSISMFNSRIGALASFKNVFVTEDGGLTWLKSKLNLNSLSQKYGLIYRCSFSDSNSIFFQVGYDTVLQDGSNRIFHYFYSNNRGLTWNLSRDTTHHGWTITFINDSVGFAAGGIPANYGYYSVIYKTTNKGDNWNINFIEMDIRDWGINNIDFIDEKNGLAVSDNFIYHTTNSGESWSTTSNINKVPNITHFGIGWANSETPIVASTLYIFKYSISTDIINKNSSASITLYPNPTADYIEIVLDNHTLKGVVIDIRIFDLLGVEVLKGMDALRRSDDSRFRGNDNAGSGETVRIDVSGLLPGVYFVRLGNAVRKFVKF